MYALSLSTGLTTEVSTADRVAGVLRDHLPAAVAAGTVHWTIRTPAGDVHSGHIGAGAGQDWITAAVDEIAADLNRPAATPIDPAFARIHLMLDIDVDVEAWANEYGLSPSQVPADARRHLTEQLHEQIAATAALWGTFTPGNITADTHEVGR